jgi:hypothetical protein
MREQRRAADCLRPAEAIFFMLPASELKEADLKGSYLSA